MAPVFAGATWGEPLATLLVRPEPARHRLAADPPESAVRLLQREPPAFALRPSLDPWVDAERPLADRILVHRVAPGDTLHALADRFGVSVETLLWANPYANVERLLPGQDLAVLPVSGLVHSVRDDETLASVAVHYGLEPAALAEANGLPAAYQARAGERLLVPGGQHPSPLPAPVALVARWPEPGTGSRNRQQFIEAAAVAAQETQRRYGIPASVTVAMAINETGWGASRLAREAHNYFGIKGRGSEGPAGVVWMNTWEVLGGRNVYLNEPFRAYHNPEESFFDYGLFFHVNRRYARALTVTHDARAFTREMAAAGFATDPDYAPKIIRIMDAWNLYQYDLR